MLLTTHIDRLIEKTSSLIKPSLPPQTQEAKSLTLEKLTLAAFVFLIAQGGIQSTALLQQAKIDFFFIRVNTVRQAWLDFEHHFKAIPGDYAYATVHIDSKLENGNGNRLLDTPSEQIQAWLHLHRAGALRLQKTELPLDNTFGHAMRLTTGQFASHSQSGQNQSENIKTQQQNILILGENIPLNTLIEVDTAIDDGHIDQGNFRLDTVTEKDTARNSACLQAAKNSLKKSRLTCSALLILPRGLQAT